MPKIKIRESASKGRELEERRGAMYLVKKQICRD